MKIIAIAALVTLAACTHATTAPHHTATYTPPDCQGDAKHQSSC